MSFPGLWDIVMWTSFMAAISHSSLAQAPRVASLVRPDSRAYAELILSVQTLISSPGADTCLMRVLTATTRLIYHVSSYTYFCRLIEEYFHV